MKFLFWNINRKNSVKELLSAILENKIDIVSLVESESLDIDSLIRKLKEKGQYWNLIEIMPMSSGIKLLAKKNINVMPKQEEKHFSIFKIDINNESFLLGILHLTSAMYKDEYARSFRASNVSRQIKKIEEETYGYSEFKTILVGDFNLQPYSAGICGVDSFNATMSISRAKKIKRIVADEEKYFYFNPMWHLMGNHEMVKGTYYSNDDQQDKSIYWYTFDEILIRPYMIDKFNWDFFKILEKTNDFDLIKNNHINKDISDHLPIKFEILL